MKKLHLLLFLLLVTIFSMPAQAEKPIPLETFVKFSQFQQLIISPTGEYMAAAAMRSDNINYVAIFDLNKMQQLSAIEFKLGELPSRLTWLNKERIGIRIAKKIGALDQPIGTPLYYAMNADGTNKDVLWGMADDSRAFGPKKYRTSMRILDLIPEDPRKILISERGGSNTGGYSSVASYTNAYEMDIYTGKTKKVASAPLRGATLLADHNQNVRFAIGVDDEDDFKVKTYYRQSNDDEWQLSSSYDTRQEGAIMPIAFTPNNQEVYATSNLGNSIQGLVKLKPGSTEVEVLYRNEVVDIDEVLWDVNDQLVGVRVSPDKTINVTLTDNQMAKWLDQLQGVFPKDTVTITSSTADASKLIVNVSSASDPGAFYLFKTKSKELQFLLNTSPWVDSTKMARVEPFTIKARDGVELRGYLTLPKGEAKNLPLIVHPHGGPHGPRDFWRFTQDAQMLASRGYAVLQLNFRGSGGYGRDFERLGYQKWGREMQDDLTDATNWAVKTGVADKNRLCIYGASYGGYAALMAVVKEPDLYKCAIGYVGVYDLPMMFKEGDIPARESGIAYLKEVLGEDQADLEARSPAYNVDKIKAALFIVQGGKDIRVPIEQMYSLTNRLDKAGYPYELMVKENEGHGFYKEEHRLELYQRMLAFLEKHIGK
ncbi:alpha/beta hydrolase family protein [Paraglaciecola aestuariivivens]